MNKFFFVTALDFLHIDDHFSMKVGFKDCLNLTNDIELIKSMISPAQALAMGTLEYNYLLSGRPVLYSTRELTEDTANHDLLDFLREVQSFLAEIWIHHDNSVNCQQAFALGVDPDSTSVNCLPVFNSSASGQDVILKASSKDFKNMLMSAPVQVDTMREEAMPIHTGLRKSRGRINVAMQHLQAARNYRDLGFKISCYCSLFEAIFSTDAVELSHQLSQRLSFFVNESPADRLNTYRLTKKAYSVRSKAVHGDVLDKTISDLVDLAVHCDEISRKVLIKFFSSPELYKLFNQGSKDEISNHFLSLFFGEKVIDI
jgi:hemoglobin-like flavoprotein